MSRYRRRMLTATVALGLVAAVLGGTDALSPVGTAMAVDVPPIASPGATDSPLVTTPAASPMGSPVPAPELAGLVLPDGEGFELGDLRGQPTFVYFGYTHCPDVCPATLGVLFGVFEQEPDTQAVFVTVDPERDTPEFLGEWTRYLPSNLYALTGTPSAIRRAADAWGVKYARAESTSSNGYAMSHTANLYLLDGEGRLVATYPFGTTSDEIVDDLRTLAGT